MQKITRSRRQSSLRFAALLLLLATLTGLTAAATRAFSHTPAAQLLRTVAINQPPVRVPANLGFGSP